MTKIKGTGVSTINNISIALIGANMLKSEIGFVSTKDLKGDWNIIKVFDHEFEPEKEYFINFNLKKLKAELLIKE